MVELATPTKCEDHRHSAVYKVMAANCEAQRTPGVEVLSEASMAIQSLLVLL